MKNYLKKCNMENKKILHGIIALLVFIALAIGAHNTTGLQALVIILAMALHAGQMVYFYGRNWDIKKTPKKPISTYKRKGGTVSPDKPEPLQPKKMDQL